MMRYVHVLLAVLGAIALAELLFVIEVLFLPVNFFQAWNLLIGCSVPVALGLAVAGPSIHRALRAFAPAQIVHDQLAETLIRLTPRGNVIDFRTRQPKLPA